jgi:hypothetical protein
VLIYQDIAFIEHHEKMPDGNWTFNVFEGLDGAFALRSIKCEIPIAEIYDRVEVSAPTPLNEGEPLLGVQL